MNLDALLRVFYLDVYEFEVYDLFSRPQTRILRGIAVVLYFFSQKNSGDCYPEIQFLNYDLSRSDLSCLRWDIRFLDSKRNLLTSKILNFTFLNAVIAHCCKLRSIWFERIYHDIHIHALVSPDSYVDFFSFPLRHLRTKWTYKTFSQYHLVHCQMSNIKAWKKYTQEFLSWME